MPSSRQQFDHWTYRSLGDASTDSACADLLTRMNRSGRFAPRAVLRRHGSWKGFRTVLLIDYRTSIRGYHGLWLVEREDRVVSCFGCERAPNARAIGGRVFNRFPVLDPEDDWVEYLARTLASTHAVEPVSTHGASSPTALLARVELGLLQDALRNFCVELDPDVLAAARGEGRMVPDAYNYYWEKRGSVRRNRVQAARVHPLFNPVLRSDWRLRQAVDRGLPLTRELAKRYQVRPLIIQRSRGLTPACVASESLASLLKRADALPTQSVPANEEDWLAFLSLADGLENLSQALGVDLGRVAQPFVNGWRTGLTTLEDRLGMPFDVEAIFEMMQAAYRYGVRPMLCRQLAEVDSTLAVSAQPPASFFRLWFGRYGLARLAEMAARWRIAYGQFSIARLGLDQRAGREVGLAWPALLDSSRSHGAYRVVELNSRQALELEGRQLDHCVASYAVKCLMADSSIFSIRDRFGSSLSTFEVQLTPAGTPKLVRHHARSNATPAPELTRIAQRFVDRVMTSVPAPQIERVRQARRAIGAPIRGKLGRPDTEQAQLSAEDRAHLEQAIAFAHPAAARRGDMLGYLRDEGPEVLPEVVRKVEG